MFVHDRVPNFVPWRMCPRSNFRGKQITVAAVCDRRTFLPHNLSFHFADNLFRFTIPAMDHQPPWTLRDPATKENHSKTERRADSKSETPSQPDRYPAGIEKHKGGGRAHRGA